MNVRGPLTFNVNFLRFRKMKSFDENSAEENLKYLFMPNKVKLYFWKSDCWQNANVLLGFW